MVKPEREMDLARRMKVIEWLKTEVLDHSAHLFKGIWEGSQSKITDALASLIVSCYILGRRFGLSYRQLDEEMAAKLGRHREQDHQLEDWYHDISALEEHLRKR